MKTLKALREEMRAFNFDTDEELDLDALADMDLDSLLGDGFGDEAETEYTPLDFGDTDLANMPIEDFMDTDAEDGEFGADISGEPTDDASTLGLDASEGEESPDDFDFDIESYELDNDESQEDFDDMSQEDADDIANNDPDAPQDNQDFQGEIRTVRGANLVFKRKMDDGNFEELWIYNVGNDIKRETQVRRAILAGTDVDPGAQESKDGSQRADTTTAGNVQFLHIVGLPQ